MTSPDDSQTAPFFIQGADRSGTTLLRRLIMDAFDVAIPPESEFIADFSGWLAVDGKPSPKDVEALWKALVRHPRYRSWGLPEVPRLLTTEFSSRVTAYRSVMTTLFDQYARARGANFWGDKTPSYIGQEALLNHIWPKARFLYIERDGRDVYCSIRNLPFGANTAYSSAVQWADALNMRRYAQEAFGTRVMAIRYEDLASDPIAVAGASGRFLSLPERDSSTRAGSTALDPTRLPWFTKIGQDVDTASIGRWSSEMNSRQVRVFESVAWTSLLELGYQPQHRQPPHQLPSHKQWGMRVVDAHLRLVNFIRLRVLHERCREVRFVLSRRIGMRLGMRP